ncbi:MAG: hypothetical protein AAGD38_23280 [Acidobacteriota bacterium]
MLRNTLFLLGFLLVIVPSSLTAERGVDTTELDLASTTRVDGAITVEAVGAKALRSRTNYQLAIAVTHSGSPAERLLVVDYHLVDKTGVIVGGGTLEQTVVLGAFDEQEVILDLAHGDLEPATAIRVDSLDLADESSRSGGTCAAFCDRCASIAGSLCTSGIANFDCQCSDDSGTTSNKCIIQCAINN